MKYLLAVKMVVVALVLAFGAQNALADLDLNDADILLEYWDVNQSQGPFSAHISDGNGASVHDDLDDFLTFCVEVNEHFYPGRTYNIDSVNSTQNSLGSFVTGYTAFVYSKFLDLASSNNWSSSNKPSDPSPYTDGSNDLGWGQVMNIFQDAIWAGMVKPAENDVPQISDLGGDTSEFYQYHTVLGYNSGAVFNDSNYVALGISVADFESSENDGWGGDLNNLGPFVVLNLSKINNLTPTQDMYVLMPSDEPPTSGPVVPEPTTLAVWSVLFAAAMGVTAWRRRRGVFGGGVDDRTQWSEDTRQAILSIIDRK